MAGGVCSCGHVWHRHRAWPGGVCKDCGCGVSDPDAARPPSADDLLVRAAERARGVRDATVEELVAELERRGAPATSSQEAWKAGWEAAMAAWGVSRGTSGREGGTTEDGGLVAKLLSVGPLEMTGVAREATVIPTRACVALGGRRSTVCGKAVDGDAEGDLCPVHQEEATAIGRDLVSLLTRLRWSRDDRR